MFNMRLSCMPTSSTMSSLPERSLTSASALKNTRPAVHYNRREMLYHVDHQGRYAVQSRDVRRPARQSPMTQPPYRRQLQASDDCPTLQPIGPAGPNQSRSTSRRNVLLVQSREGYQLDRSGSKSVAADSPGQVTTPPAPRPQRLPTPEISDPDEAEPFCYCDVKKKCDSSRGCVHEWALV